MARQARSGLGRGLGSLLGSSNDGNTTQRTTNRERVVYNEDEALDYSTGEINLKNQQLTNNSQSPAGAPLTTGGNIGVFERTAPEKDHPLSSQKTSEMKRVSISETPTPSQQPSITGNLKPIETTNVSRETSKEIPTQKKETKKEKPVNTNPNEIDIELVEPNPDQPRTNFKKDELEELSRSIKKEGLIQPIVVRIGEGGKYQIIAGERRWQAAKLVGLKRVPIQVMNVDDDKALELALIENIQRSDLNPIEEAYGYKRLMERRKMTQADVAQAVSKGRSTIANALRLLDLPEEAQQLLFEDVITAGHARAILSVPSKEARESLTKKLAEQKLSVRETENLARLMSNRPTTTTKKEPTPAIYKSVSKALKEILNTNVKIKSSKGKNKIEIEFKDEKDLERLFEEITASTEE